jgi:hypothetical protein
MNIADSVVAEPAWHRTAWTWVVVSLTVAALLLILLGGCAGTALSFKGQVCGMPVAFHLRDMKDRSGFTASVTCPTHPGGSLTIASTDSSTSTVLAEQAALLDKMTSLLAGVLAQATAAGAGYKMEDSQQ